MLKKNIFYNILIPTFFNNEVIQQFYIVHQLPKLKGLKTYCEMIKSENTLEMYEGLVGIRTILSKKLLYFLSEKTLLALCESNVFKYLIHIIEHNQFQLIINQALQILVILASNSSQIVDQIIQNRLINCLIHKLSQGYHDLIIELICRIFNRVSMNNRDLLINLGALKIFNTYVIEKIKEFENLDLINNLVQFFSSLFESDLMLPLQDVLISLKFFSKLIQKDFPLENLQYICQLFFQFANFDSSQIQIIIDLGIMPRIIELVEVENFQIFSANIQLLNQVLESHQNHQEYLNKLGIIQCLGRLINKYRQDNFIIPHLSCILYAFKVISRSKYLSQFLLNSNELDYLLSMLDFNDFDIQQEIHLILKKLIENNKDIDSKNSIQNNKLIMLSNLLAFRDQTQQQQALCKRNYFPIGIEYQDKKQQ